MKELIEKPHGKNFALNAPWAHFHIESSKRSLAVKRPTSEDRGKQHRARRQRVGQRLDTINVWIPVQTGLLGHFEILGYRIHSYTKNEGKLLVNRQIGRSDFHRCEANATNRVLSAAPSALRKSAVQAFVALKLQYIANMPFARRASPILQPRF